MDNFLNQDWIKWKKHGKMSILFSPKTVFDALILANEKYTVILFWLKFQKFLR